MASRLADILAGKAPGTGTATDDSFLGGSRLNSLTLPDISDRDLLEDFGADDRRTVGFDATKDFGGILPNPRTTFGDRFNQRRKQQADDLEQLFRDTDLLNNEFGGATSGSGAGQGTGTGNSAVSGNAVAGIPGIPGIATGIPGLTIGVSPTGTISPSFNLAQALGVNSPVARTATNTVANIAPSIFGLQNSFNPLTFAVPALASVLGPVGLALAGFKGVVNLSEALAHGMGKTTVNDTVTQFNALRNSDPVDALTIQMQIQPQIEAALSTIAQTGVATINTNTPEGVTVANSLTAMGLQGAVGPNGTTIMGPAINGVVGLRGFTFNPRADEGQDGNTSGPPGIAGVSGQGPAGGLGISGVGPGTAGHPGPAPGEVGGVGPGGGGGGKVICTAMNAAYGFGTFRNAVWLDYAKKNLTPEHEKGYHRIALPLIRFAFVKDGNWLQRATRAVMEHIVRHRSVDLWLEKKGGHRRDLLGRMYRTVLEPFCQLVGKVGG